VKIHQSVSLTPSLVRSLLSSKVERVFVAYSGGQDSHVLLHLCAQDRSLQQKITAVYVHHGLQLQADHWAEHCEQEAARLGVAFLELKVNATSGRRQSPEESARDARYAAFRQLLSTENDVLLLAQHREDQMETVLLQLLRGAGITGLAAMPVQTPFASGMMVRPFLDVAKAEIVDYAQRHQLTWVEDPSNQTVEFDRNFLRKEVVPLLRQRWPTLDKTVARSARHCASAEQLLAEWAEQRLLACFNEHDRTLALSPLKTLNDEGQVLVLRRWFARLGLRMPAESRLQKIITEVMGAKQDANPVVEYGECQIRRYKNQLHCVPKQALLIGESRQWQPEAEVVQCDNGYMLRRISAEQGIPVRHWQTATITIRRRRGGEVIRLVGKKNSRPLKKLLQEQGVPPWFRDVVPLIYLNEQLAAVAGIGICADFYSQNREPCYQIEWIRVE
jgi:tRNA(Ile)-lysidine synthase